MLVRYFSTSSTKYFVDRALNRVRVQSIPIRLGPGIQIFFGRVDWLTQANPRTRDTHYE